MTGCSLTVDFSFHPSKPAHSVFDLDGGPARGQIRGGHHLLREVLFLFPVRTVGHVADGNHGHKGLQQRVDFVRGFPFRSNGVRRQRQVRGSFT